MTFYVIDACVAIKWFVLEIHNEAALRLRHSAYQLHVPNFFLLEFGNVVGKKYRRGEITLIYNTETFEEVATLPADKPSGIFFSARAHKIGL